MLLGISYDYNSEAVRLMLATFVSIGFKMLTQHRFADVILGANNFVSSFTPLKSFTSLF